MHFGECYHVIRRGDRYWVGMSADMIIEQVLMRNLKTIGGLTRGSGMTESQRLVWLLSTPSCAQVNCTMQELAAMLTFCWMMARKTGVVCVGTR